MPYALTLRCGGEGRLRQGKVVGRVTWWGNGREEYARVMRASAERLTCDSQYGVARGRIKAGP